jgi:hypothetical protein
MANLPPPNQNLAEQDPPDPNTAIQQIMATLAGLERQLTTITLVTEETRTLVQAIITATEARQAYEAARRQQNIANALHNQPAHPWFYAVAIGRVPGVYNTPTDANEQTLGFHGSLQQRFRDHALAVRFVADNRPTVPPLFIEDRLGADAQDRMDDF